MLDKKWFFLRIICMFLLTGCNISGTVRYNGVGFEGVMLHLSGGASASATTDSEGNYVFMNLEEGTYTLTPEKEGYLFSPETIVVTIDRNTTPEEGVTGIDFTVSGRILTVYPETENRLTLATALKQALPGDTLLLSSGEYYPPDRLTPLGNGLEAQPITIKASQPGAAIINANGNKYGFILSNKSYIHIEGLTLKGHFSGCGAKLIQCDHITLKQLTVINCQSHNISLVDSHSNRIENCEVTESRSIGINVVPQNLGLESTADNTIIGNASHHNARSGILVYGNNNFISQNRAYNNGSIDPYDHGVYCIGNGNTVAENICNDNGFGSGIRLGDRNHVVRGNTCFRNGGSGIIVGGTNDSHDILIENNDLEENAHSGVQINSSDFNPSGITLSGNTFRANGYNVSIQENVTQVTITHNFFDDPALYQMKLWMSQEIVNQEVVFDGNTFWGPDCLFSVGGSDVPAEDFLGIVQPGATCEDASL